MSDSRHGSIDRRLFVKGAGAVAATVALPAFSAPPQARPPNILFILADDLGFADLSCYGRRDYRTPVLDRLAAAGLLMTQGYSNSAVCSPTRVALITGRYHQRLPVGLPEPLRTAEQDPVGLSGGQPTLPSLLKQAGYRTALVGKWHMGWPPEYSPLKCGYDSFFGIPPGAVDYISHHGPNRGEFPNMLFEGNTPVERTGYLTDLLAERAVAEIRALGNAKPFLLSLHFTAPHWPWQGRGDPARPPTLAGLWHKDGGSLEKFAEMVLEMDAAVGRVLDELDRQDMARDTIVVFTSDNGGERFSDTWPLRGGKGELLEGGIRVPTIVRWPARIKPASRSDQAIVSMDWLPTLLAAAGGSPDRDHRPDGENLLDVLTGAAPPRPRKLYWRFKAKGQAAARDGDWKYLRMDGEEFLFDIRRDPRERADLKDKEQARFERLRADFAAWDATMLPYPSDPLRPGAQGSLDAAGRAFSAAWRS